MFLSAVLVGVWPPSKRLRRRHGCRAFAPTSTAASHDNHEKASYTECKYGGPLGRRPGRVEWKRG